MKGVTKRDLEHGKEREVKIMMFTIRIIPKALIL